MAENLKEKYAKMLEDPNVRRALNMIGAAESTNRYNIGIGGGTWDLSKPGDGYKGHPGKKFSFRGKPGSDAGRYQIIEKTWKGLADKLGLDNFNDPKQQDLAAVALLDEVGGLGLAQQGKYNELFSLPKIQKTWYAIKNQGGGETFVNKFKDHPEIAFGKPSTDKDIKQAYANRGKDPWGRPIATPTVAAGESTPGSSSSISASSSIANRPLYTKEDASKDLADEYGNRNLAIKAREANEKNIGVSAVFDDIDPRLIPGTNANLQVPAWKFLVRGLTGGLIDPLGEYKPATGMSLPDMARAMGVDPNNVKIGDDVWQAFMNDQRRLQGREDMFDESAAKPMAPRGVLSEEEKAKLQGSEFSRGVAFNDKGEMIVPGQSRTDSITRDWRTAISDPAYARTQIDPEATPMTPEGATSPQKLLASSVSNNFDLAGAQREEFARLANQPRTIEGESTNVTGQPAVGDYSISTINSRSTPQPVTAEQAAENARLMKREQDSGLYKLRQQIDGQLQQGSTFDSNTGVYEPNPQPAQPQSWTDSVKNKLTNAIDSVRSDAMNKMFGDQKNEIELPPGVSKAVDDAVRSTDGIENILG